VTTLIEAMLIAAPVAWVAAGLAVFMLPRSTARIRVVALFGTLGSSALAVTGITSLTQPHEVMTVVLGSWQGLGSANLRVDAFSGFFLALTGVTSSVLFIGRVGTLGRTRGRLPVAGLAILLIALELVFIAANGFLFLLGWEALALSFYVLVVANYRGPREATSAAYWTMAMAKLSGACILGAFVLLFAASHSLDFSSFPRAVMHAGQPLIDGIFVLAFLGFGIKTALLPVQSWLPRAYPAAPVGVPAFLAAVGLNAGFYGFIRILSWLPAGPIWWGSLVVLIGSVTAVVGILYAAAQNDLKRLIAYSSIENAGMIMTGIGTSMIGRSAGLPLLVGLGLVAALLQMTVHTVSKAGLFLCADGIERHTETTDMERLGGLAKTVPGVAAAFMVCSAALVGLPPTGGFASEWLMLESLMQGFRTQALLSQVVMAIAGALLALTAAVAGIAFVKATFATFLGVQREHRPVIRLGRMVAISAGVFAAMSLAVGIAIPWIVPTVANAAAAAGSTNVGGHISTGQYLIEPAFAKFSSIAPTQIALVLLGFGTLIVIIGYIVRNRKVQNKRTPVWNSGAVPFQANTQYTPTGWSNPTRVVFDSVLHTRRSSHLRGPHLARFGVRYSSQVPLLIDEYVILPIARGAQAIGSALQRLQSGHLSRYLFYVLGVLVLSLLVVPLVVR
jgi:hydrogenase-4 component B